MTEKTQLQAGETCPDCGRGLLGRQLVKSTLWHGERLVLVDNIPAMVCASCGERHFDDATAMALDLMHGDGFPPELAVDHMHVPIFSFSQRVPPELIATAEDQE